MRLDRLLNKLTRRSNKDIRTAIWAGEITVNAQLSSDEAQRVTRFDAVAWNGEVLAGETALYIALHKPADYLSANQDRQHKTVFELLPEAWRSELHIAGRLDLGSTGLLLLSNDGSWTKQITAPATALSKCYRVQALRPLSEAQRIELQSGIYFQHEGITTRPCQIQPLAEPAQYRVTLQEGRYRHIRRLFGHVDNKVLALHRESIGRYELPESLQAGDYLELSEQDRRKVLMNPAEAL